MLEVRNISLRIAGRHILSDVSFSLGPGELVGLIGPNGSGKTTLLHAMNGLCRPDLGRILLEGRPLAYYSVRDLARRIAAVPQVADTSFGFTGQEMVRMGCFAAHPSFFGDNEQDAETVRSAMTLTDTLSLANLPVTVCSGGERRRLLVARALAQDCPIMLLDEPGAELDLHHALDLFRLLTRLCAEGRTVLCALHDINLAALFCRRILCLHRGRLAMDGPPEEVITADALREVFSARVTVLTHPRLDRPQILADP